MAILPVAESWIVAHGKQTFGTNPRSSYHSSGVNRKSVQRYFTIDGFSLSKIAPPIEYTYPLQVPLTP